LATIGWLHGLQLFVINDSDKGLAVDEDDPPDVANILLELIRTRCYAGQRDVLSGPRRRNGPGRTGDSGYLSSLSHKTTGTRILFSELVQVLHDAGVPLLYIMSIGTKWQIDAGPTKAILDHLANQAAMSNDPDLGLGPADWPQDGDGSDWVAGKVMVRYDIANVYRRRLGVAVLAQCHRSIGDTYPAFRLVQALAPERPFGTAYIFGEKLREVCERTTSPQTGFPRLAKADLYATTPHLIKGIQ
ncbi:Hypothetical Protein FCC1311_118082, partial [Hondaea fermentalgiana]